MKALKALGQIKRDAGHAQESLALNEESVAICRDIGDPLPLAHTLRHVGDLHLSAGRPAPAAMCFDEALALYRADDATAPIVPYLERWHYSTVMRSFPEFEDAQAEKTNWTTVWTLAPGFRTGWNVGNTQTILGFSVPVIITKNQVSVGAFGYFSYELPFSTKP